MDRSTAKETRAKPGKEGDGQKRTPARLLFTLALAAVAGVLFDWATLPLPWILGPLTATAVAAVAGAPVAAPTPIRPYVVAAIGVMLGSAFTPAFLEQIGAWAVSFAFLGFYIIVSAIAVVPYYRHVAGFGNSTAFFAGMPGGLSEMVVAGGDMGGDDRDIVMAHVTRITIVVALVAFWFRGVQGVDLSGRPSFGLPLAEIPPNELLVMLGAGVAGFFAGKSLRWPAPNLLGPMLASAVVHLTEWTTNPAPIEVSIIAQVLLGTIMGGRFIGVPPERVFRAFRIGIGATVIMLLVTFALALAVYPIIGQPLDQVILAFSPGGLAEMSIVALAMNADIVYVSSHHVVRIAVVMAFAPVAFRLMRRLFP